MTQRSNGAKISHHEDVWSEGEISRLGAHTNDQKREENSCQNVLNGNKIL